MREPMSTTGSRGGRGFSTLMAVPLLFYFLVVLSLLLADILYLGPGITLRPFSVSWEGPRRFWETVTSPEIRFALGLSLVTSVITVLLSIVIAIPTGYVLSRRRFFGAALVDTIIDMPIVLPPLAVGLSLLVFFSQPMGKWLDAHGLKLVFQPAGIVAAQFVVACAFAIRMMKATFDGIETRYESVVRTLGFGPWRAFLKGCLPLARNGIVAAAVVTWARAVGEFGPVIVFCGATRFRTEVLPTSAYLEVSVGNLHAALSVALLMIAAALVVLILLKKFGGKAYLV
jgi:molybdate transport system permease protein